MRSRDQLHVETREIAAQQATQLFEYDPSGNLIANLDFKGQLSTFEFDEVSRESARTDAENGKSTPG